MFVYLKANLDAYKQRRPGTFSGAADVKAVWAAEKMMASLGNPEWKLEAR